MASTFSARALASFNEENPSSRSLLPKWACTGILILPTSHTVRAGGAPIVGGGGEEVGSTLYSGLYAEAPLKRITFFRLKVYERVAILLIEVYERVGKSVLWVCERAQRANRWILGLLKSRKRSIFVIDSYSYLIDSAITTVNKDAKVWTRYVKRVPFINRRLTKGVPFLWKMVYKRIRGLLPTPPKECCRRG